MTKKVIRIGRIAGLDLSARLNAFLTFDAMWIGLAALSAKRLRTPVKTAAAMGFAATLGHYASELWHHFGHAAAARRTGYPMSGVELIGPLGRSLYPADEPDLPPETHIRRALGGPVYSAILTAVLAAITRGLPANRRARTVMAFLTLDNLLIFTLGAFLPLGFTDGSTVWREWRRKRAAR